MSSQAEKAKRFMELHRREHPLLLANAWDVGSATLLTALGFQALATTSSGHAASLGRLDYAVTREDALSHAAELVASTDLPVSADLEDCFAADPSGVAETVRLAIDAGLAGCSIEDWSAAGDRLYDPGEAAERVAAAAEAAHSGPVPLVLTARAENHLRGVDDLSDTIARLLAYMEAGADVLYAPGLVREADIREVVDALDAPVNVLVRTGAPTVPELGAIGVARVSVGGAFAFVALGAAEAAARELLEDGTYGFIDVAQAGGRAARAFFSA